MYVTTTCYLVTSLFNKSFTFQVRPAPRVFKGNVVSRVFQEWADPQVRPVHKVSNVTVHRQNVEEHCDEEQPLLLI